MAYRERIAREDEYDRVRGFLRAEADASDTRIRGAFHAAAEGLLTWQEPPCSLADAHLWISANVRAGRMPAGWTIQPNEYRRLEGITVSGSVYRPYDPQGDVEPYNVEADWNERGI